MSVENNFFFSEDCTVTLPCVSWGGFALGMQDAQVQIFALGDKPLTQGKVTVQSSSKPFSFSTSIVDLKGIKDIVGPR